MEAIVAEIVAIDTPSLGDRRAPNVPTCSDGGGSTQCQSTGNVQIYTMPAPTNSTYGPFLGYQGGRN